ncbi:MAG: tetratricopeptide repeat protein [Actinomycetota bacterium]
MTVATLQSADELFEAAAAAWKAGATQDAEAYCRRVLQQNPAHADAWGLLGKVAGRLGNLGLAAAFLGKAVAAAPEDPGHLCRLGVVHLRRNDLPQAAAQFGRALELDPGYSRAYVNLGVVFLNEGRVREAVANFRRGLELQPDDADVHTNLLFALHYLPDPTRTELFELARDWGRRHAQLPEGACPAPPRPPVPDRRLRVGYVSGNFAAHPVGYFLEPVLRAHRRAEVETFCYTNRHTVDHVTQRLRESADHWRSVMHTDDEEAARLVRQDGIDILVDLSGHTSWHRLRLFARKPAPVQVSWMGYFDTTGVSAMDYLLADRFVCPPGDERFYVERIVRLPGCYLCYRPQTELEVGALPSLTQGAVTFGCFNKLAKITPEAIRAWSRILHELPGARLVLRDGGFDHVSVRERVLRQFSDTGVGPERMELHGRSSHQEYLASYGAIDIALDPFPYNGGATTVEALWMGVPVVSLAGERFVSRMGLTHLTAIGLSDLAASTTDEYVAKAIQLAADVPRLSRLRSELRGRVAGSALCDGDRFVAGLEAAYRMMWRSWCLTAASGSGAN